MVRVSGPDAAPIAARVSPRLDWSRPRVVQLVELVEADGRVLDRGTAVVYHGPRSATGEDLLEVTVHGSPYLVRRLEEAFAGAGARPAGPGEFTRRAVANGKLDLVQAEAIRDLIDADTVWQARLARRPLDGALSRRCDGLRCAVVDLLARIEAALDFAGHGIGLDEDGIDAVRTGVLETMDALIATARVGERVRHGARVAIIGPPNAGKSTLFNGLVGRERAIVAPTPGTTRDVLEAELDLGGVPVVVADTAGLRAGGDAVEAEGHRRAIAEADRADVVVLLWPADGERPAEPAAGSVVRVWSKADLAAGEPPAGWIRTAAAHGQGVDAVRAALVDRIMAGVAQLDDAVAVDLRHRGALERARAAVARAPLGAPELAADDLGEAVRSMEELLGTVDAEDVLDAVFRTFCIGK